MILRTIMLILLQLLVLLFTANDDIGNIMILMIRFGGFPKEPDSYGNSMDFKKPVFLRKFEHNFMIE